MSVYLNNSWLSRNCYLMATHVSISKCPNPNTPSIFSNIYGNIYFMFILISYLTISLMLLSLLSCWNLFSRYRPWVDPYDKQLIIVRSIIYCTDDELKQLTKVNNATAVFLPTCIILQLLLINNSLFVFYISYFNFKIIFSLNNHKLVFQGQQFI